MPGGVSCRIQPVFHCPANMPGKKGEHQAANAKPSIKVKCTCLSAFVQDLDASKVTSHRHRQQDRHADEIKQGQVKRTKSGKQGRTRETRESQGAVMVTRALGPWCLRRIYAAMKADHRHSCSNTHESKRWLMCVPFGCRGGAGRCVG